MTVSSQPEHSRTTLHTYRNFIVSPFFSKPVWIRPNFRSKNWRHFVRSAARVRPFPFFAALRGSTVAKKTNLIPYVDSPRFVSNFSSATAPINKRSCGCMGASSIASPLPITRHPHTPRYTPIKQCL